MCTFRVLGLSCETPAAPDPSLGPTRPGEAPTQTPESHPDLENKIWPNLVLAKLGLANVGAGQTWKNVLAKLGFDRSWYRSFYHVLH